MQENKDIEIYKKYMEAQESGELITDLCDKLGISRTALYDALRRVRNGDTAKLNRCIKLGRLECLWFYKYHPRYSVLPKNRRKSTVAELKSIINDMRDDGFPVMTIAKKLKKPRSHIQHHLDI